MRHEAYATGEWTERPIAGERLAILRREMQHRSLSFPSQIPSFAQQQQKQDVQWRVVALYFVRGWSCGDLARRYALTPGRIRQLIRKWVERAAALGYVQRIPPQTGSAIPAVEGTPASVEISEPALMHSSHLPAFAERHPTAGARGARVDPVITLPAAR